MKKSFNFEDNYPGSDLTLSKSKVFNRLLFEEDFYVSSSTKRLLKETGDGKIAEEYCINYINWRNQLTLKTIVLKVI